MEPIKQVCKDCGTEFEITVRDQEFLREKGWDLYVRCLICRRKRKMLKYESELPPRSPKRV